MNLLGKGERRRLRVTLTPIAAGFLAGRLVSYPLLALTARGINDHFGSLLTKGRRDPKIIALEVLSILGVVLFARIDWPRLLHLPCPQCAGRPRPQVRHGAGPSPSRVEEASHLAKRRRGEHQRNPAAAV